MLPNNQLNLKEIKSLIENNFHNLLEKSFPKLQAVNKWKQIMWHNEERIIVSLVFGKNKIKFCFFNNPTIKLDKLQRWSQTVYSQNLEIKNESLIIDWVYIKELIQKTLLL
jgi:hypothetical protein